MARIWIADYEVVREDDRERIEDLEFGLDRECVPVIDTGGPWVRERRTLDALNRYLSLFGLEVEVFLKDVIDVRVIEPKEPQDLCEHETNLYGMEVTEVDFVGGEGYVIDADVPCGTCNTRRSIRFTIPEDVGDWPEEDEDADEG